MGIREITQRELRGFADMLASEERSSHTREKYLRDVRSFALFLGGRELTREQVQSYKRHLLDAGYAVNSVNSMLASLNRLLRFLGREDCLVRSIRSQRPAYCSEAKELTREEYLRLLEAAKQKPRLRLLLETLAGRGSGFRSCSILRWRRYGTGKWRSARRRNTGGSCCRGNCKSSCWPMRSGRGSEAG